MIQETLPNGYSVTAFRIKGGRRSEHGTIQLSASFDLVPKLMITHRQLKAVSSWTQPKPAQASTTERKTTDQFTRAIRRSNELLAPFKAPSGPDLRSEIISRCRRIGLLHPDGSIDPQVEALISTAFT